MFGEETMKSKIIGILILLFLLGASSLWAQTNNPPITAGSSNDFYNYTIIAEQKPQLELIGGDISRLYGALSLNNNGVVAFYANELDGGLTRKSVLKGDGGPLAEIFSTIFEPHFNKFKILDNLWCGNVLHPVVNIKFITSMFKD